MNLSEFKELFAEHKRNGVFRDIGGLSRSMEQQLEEEGRNGYPFMLSCLNIHDEIIYLAINIDEEPEDTVINLFHISKSPKVKSAIAEVLRLNAQRDRLAFGDNFAKDAALHMRQLNARS